MSMTSVETSARSMSNYGGLADAIGGAAAVVLAIIGLSGTQPDTLLAIATIVFGSALLIQSGTIMTELTHMMSPTTTATPEEFSSGSLSFVFLAGVAGIVLGVLALIGIQVVVLTSVAVIVFGSALVFGSAAVWSLHRMKQASMRQAGQPVLASSEILVTEMAAGSAGLQAIGGMAGIVLGILAVTGINPIVLSLVGLLAMGAAILLSGSTMSGFVQGFMRPSSSSQSWSQSLAE